jgi:hypothetical protein
LGREVCNGTAVGDTGSPSRSLRNELVLVTSGQPYRVLTGIVRTGLRDVPYTGVTPCPTGRVSATKGVLLLTLDPQAGASPESSCPSWQFPPRVIPASAVGIESAGSVVALISLR